MVIGTPGADDHATGTAALRELARLAARSTPARERGDAITAMLALESIGYYRTAASSQHYPPVLGWFYPSVGDFVAMVGDLRSRPLVHRVVRDLRSHTALPSRLQSL